MVVLLQTLVELLTIVSRLDRMFVVATTASHRPADLDLWCALLRYVAEVFITFILVFTSDFRGAYRQISCSPDDALMFVVVTWDAIQKKRVFGMAATQLFGSGNAPLNFCRYPDFCCRLLARLFAIASVHCVDDILCAERASTCFFCFLRLA